MPNLPFFCQGANSKLVQSLSLSEVYVNILTKLQWECDKVHRCFAVPSAITSGSKCPKYGGYERGTIEEIQELAKSKSGKYLSAEYKNSWTKLSWRCADGHEWETTPSSVKLSNSWCPQCKRYYSYS